MGNSVRYGLYVCVCLFAGWAYWHQLSRGWQRSSLLLVPLFLAAVFFTYTRSVWLGLAAGGCIVAALTLHGRVRVAVLGSAIGVGLLVCVVNWQRLVFLEREQSGEYAAVSATNRAAHAYVSWKIFKDRPLTGCGFGQYPVAKLSYLGDRNTRLNIHRLRNRVSHNTILTLAAEVGVVGLALYLALLIAWTNDAVAIWRAPGVPPWARRQAVVFIAALSVYLMQALFHEVTYRSHINAIMFTLAAVTTGLRCGELRAPLLTRAESLRSFPPCDEPQSP